MISKDAWGCKVLPFVTGLCHFSPFYQFSFHPQPSQVRNTHWHQLSIVKWARKVSVRTCVLWEVINYTQAIFCISLPPPPRWGFRGCFRLLITSPITIRLETCNLPRRKRKNQSIVSVALHAAHRPERLWEGEAVHAGCRVCKVSRFLETRLLNGSVE